MNAQKRLEYIDALKVLAIFSIISLHIFQIWMNGEQIMHLDIYGFAEITRFGVPIFLMISGVLLLNRNIEIHSFFKKKLIRICYPFIFYTIIYIVLVYPKYVNIFIHNWYFWMILGVYLVIPIMNKFIQNSTMKEIEYYLIILVFASIFYQVLFFFNIGHFFNLNFFFAPISYLILGYYLSKKEWGISRNKIISICILLFCLVTMIKILGVWEIIPKALTENYKATQSKMLLSWLDVGVLEIIQASSLFLAIKNIYETRTGIYSKIKEILEINAIKNFILSVSKASYGMYLVNAILMIPLIKYLKDLPNSGFQICIFIIIFSLIIFFISWLTVLIVSRIPFIKKFSGYS